MSKIFETKQELLDTGLFKGSFYSLPEKYRLTLYAGEDRDNVLTGTNNILFEFLEEDPIVQGWYKIFESGTYAPLTFEQVLDEVPSDTQALLLFHLDIFAGEHHEEELCT